MDMMDYLDAFLSETQDNLDALSAQCLVLEREGATTDIFASMFRAAHTVKGMSATMGFSQMSQLTHRLEDVLGHLQKSPADMGQRVVDTLFSAIDALEANLNGIRETGDESSIENSTVIQKLEGLFVEHSSGGSLEADDGFDTDTYELIRTLKTDGHTVTVLRVTLDETCAMKAVRMFMVMQALEQFGDVIATTPSTQVLETGEFDSAVHIAIRTDRDVEKEMCDAVKQVSEVKDVQVIDGNLTAAAKVQSPPVAATVSKHQDDSQPASSGGDKTNAPSAQRVREQTLRVPVSRIDEFMNVLSELVIARTRLDMLAKERQDSELMAACEQITRLSESLQDGVMNMRMMPVESLFQRFPRMMRDLQKTLERSFDFEMSGMETEMDRTVIDEMAEALVHLLRNAADHGLESPADRVQAGKSAAGKIRLSAYATGGHVYLEVADDGAGVNRDKVLEKAISKGIVDPAKAASMTDSQVYDLLFASGFSTAAAVSDISGRGVGLDAVRSKVESLGGTIRIDSELGKGSTFTIQLPLTLTIMQAMMIQVGDEVFAIPANNVVEVARFRPQEVRRVHDQRVITYQDKIVPIVDLNDYFFAAEHVAKGEWLNTVICREGNRLITFLVDDVLDDLEIVNKPLGQYLQQHDLFSGATILGDGHVALIVDVHHFFKSQVNRVNA